MPRASLCLLVTLSLAALTGCAPQLSPVVTVLEPVEHTLSGAAVQRHKIDLPADSYFHIEVEQLGIDVFVEVLAPRGKSITTVNTPTARVGSESALIKTSEAGTYQVLLRSNEHVKKEGRYRLAIEQLAANTRDDKRRIKAQQAMTEAARLNFNASLESESKVIEKLRVDAIAYYEIAQSELHRLRKKEEEAWALYYMAAQYYELYEWKVAAALAEDAAVLFSESKDQLIWADALQMQGMALIETHEKADFKIALNKFSEALDLQRASGSLYDQAHTTNHIGMAYYHQGKLAKARVQFAKAGDMFNTLGEPQQAIWTLNNIASMDRKLGDYIGAIQTFKKALSVPESKEYKPERAKILDNLADAHAILGDFEDALLMYREAADLFEVLGDRLGKARALSGTGLTYGRLDNWGAALEFFEQALALQQGPAEHRALFNTHVNIGNAHRNLGQPTEALKAHNEALQLAKLPAEKANTLIELGRDHAAIGNHADALDQFKQALTAAVGDEAAAARAVALQELGRLKVAQNIDVVAGLSDLQEALRQHRALHSQTGEAQTLRAMARAEHKLGHPAKALAYAANALDITEALRLRVGNPNLRLSFTGLQLPTYELHIALLMELAASQSEAGKHESDYTALALEVSERARARSLVELLTEARTDEAQGFDPKLLNARNEKRKQLAGLAYTLEMQIAEGNTATATIRTELHAVKADLDVIEARIRKQNRQYAELIQPGLLKAADIQNLLAPDESDDKSTVLLEYSLGKEQSYLWYVTENSIESWSLPPRADIEAAAREAYENFKTLDLDSASRSTARRANVKLADLILAPVTNRLKGLRVVIVPDGALQYIPFGALPVPGSSSSPVPLLEQNEVVTLPSAATLAMLRTAQVGRKPAKKAVAIFADPVFNQQDARLAGSTKIERRTATRSTEEGRRDLMRLPSSGIEADAIADLAAPAQVLKATGFAANRSSVLDTALDEFRYVHFATHGLINSRYPELSSLALSAFDENGAPQPGFLRLHDIYSLKLRADLVVLSACETALGKDVRGEGLIGLTRGFMYAGATGVIASLWRASDEATATLMQEFYRLMLKKNLEPADALRKAQLAIFRQRKWRDPYYWAGFVLQGDWRQRGGST